MTDRILTIVGWLGIVLVAIAAGRFAAVDPAWDAYLVWAAALGILAVAVYAVGARRQTALAGAAAHRARRPTGVVIAAVAIAVALNVAAGSYRLRLDVTPNRVYVPAPQTRAVLRALDSPVRVRVFARQAAIPALRDRFDEYAAAAPHLAVEYVDLDAPQAATGRETSDAALQTGRETAIVEYRGRSERVQARNEEDVANALIRLREGRTRKIYFTTGHAERDTSSTERAGYSGIVERIRRGNFDVATINIARDGDVPPDATLLVAAGPRVDFFRAEIDALRRYLERGGSIVFLVDPFEDLKRYITESGNALFLMDPSSVSSAGELRNLTAFIHELGVELGNDVVVDASERGQFLGTDASVPVVTTYPPHPITEGLTSLTAFPMARSAAPVAGAGGASPIIETAADTWSEHDLQQVAAGRLSMDAARGDRPGPMPLGVAVSRPPVAMQRRAGKEAANWLDSFGAGDHEPRVVVVGDSDFVANYSSNVPGNPELFLSIVRWLTQEKVLVVPPRMVNEARLEMSGQRQRIALSIALLFLPGLAFGVAAYVYHQRAELPSRGD